MRKFFPVLLTGVAVSFSQIAYSQIDIRGRGVTGDIQNSQSVGSGQTTQQQGTGNAASNTTQSGTQNQNSQQYGGSNSSSTGASGSTAGATGDSSTSGSYDNGQ